MAGFIEIMRYLSILGNTETGNTDTVRINSRTGKVYLIDIPIAQNKAFGVFVTYGNWISPDVVH